MGNTANNFTIIRVSPTLDTGAYADNDVFFNSTAIPSAVIGNGGCSKLIGITILNEDDVAHDIDLVFMQKSTDLANALNVAVGTGSKWTNALAKAAGVCGVVSIDWSTNSVDMVNNLIYHQSFGNHAAAETSGLPMMLQAEDDSTSVFFAGISRGGTPTAAADDYEFIFHLER